ncbi:MAG: hypothetical protein JSV89_15110 [Spirochaetaceae bacterium]|nr:MAG: hypothetical protein JSV89_15110 [Spirochaetaceae bacterium]
MSGDTFDNLILIGRPASGKSEIIDHLSSLDAGQRGRLHLGELVVVDDFPMLWTWLEEDKLLSEMGKSRLHTNEEGYFKEDYQWDLLVRRLCLEYEKHRAERPQGSTVIIEFSRGSSHGGYRRAFQQLSDRILGAAVVLYVSVSFQESIRKNRRRFNPQAPHSILEHSLPDEKMRRLYAEDDWSELCQDPHFLSVGDLQIPYAVFENEEDYTTAGGSELEHRLVRCFEELWRVYASGKAAGEKKGPRE